MLCLLHLTADDVLRLRVPQQQWPHVPGGLWADTRFSFQAGKPPPPPVVHRAPAGVADSAAAAAELCAQACRLPCAIQEWLLLDKGVGSSRIGPPLFWLPLCLLLPRPPTTSSRSGCSCAGPSGSMSTGRSQNSTHHRVPSARWGGSLMVAVLGTCCVAAGSGLFGKPAERCVLSAVQHTQ